MTSRPDNVWPDMWKHMFDTAKKRAKKDGLGRTHHRSRPACLKSCSTWGKGPFPSAPREHAKSTKDLAMARAAEQDSRDPPPKTPRLLNAFPHEAVQTALSHEPTSSRMCVSVDHRPPTSTPNTTNLARRSAHGGIHSQLDTTEEREAVHHLQTSRVEHVERSQIPHDVGGDLVTCRQPRGRSWRRHSPRQTPSSPSSQPVHKLC